jgi:hypothetical protein
MPFRLDEFRAKVQFITSAQTPSLIFEAAKATGKVSNTQYLQHVVAEALARDLGLDLGELLDALPEPKGKAGVLFGPDRRPVKRSPETVGEAR